MKEDYVSFETAKQLKEKGFDLECKSFYYDNGKFDTRQVVMNFNKSESCFTAPTLYIAQKWLRKQHNIHIDIIWLRNKYRGCEIVYGYAVTAYINNLDMRKHSEGFIADYETNLDNAIKTALTMI